MHPPLSPKAAEYFSQLDVDDFFTDWQIPIIHKPEYNELKQKGWLVRGSKQGNSADGTKVASLEGWVFADDIIAAKDSEMFR